MKTFLIAIIGGPLLVVAALLGLPLSIAFGLAVGVCVLALMVLWPLAGLEWLVRKIIDLLPRRDSTPH